MTAVRNDACRARRAGPRSARHRRGARDVAQQRDLAEAIAAPKRRAGAPVDRDLELAVGDHVEAVAGLALADDHRPGRDVRGSSARASDSSAGAPERREERERAQAARARQRARWRRRSIASRRRPDERARRRQDAPRPMNAARPPREGDQRGREQRADGQPGHGSPRAARTRARAASGGAMRCSSVRPATSTTVRPAPAEREQRQCRRLAANAPSTTKRAAQTTGRRDERRCEPSPPDERDRRRDPEHAARAERGVQVAGARAAEVEHADREHDEEHVERADRDRLRARAGQTRAGLRLAREARRPERVLALPPPAAAAGPRSARRGAPPASATRRHHREHRARLPTREQHARHRRGDEHARCSRSSRRRRSSPSAPPASARAPARAPPARAASPSPRSRRQRRARTRASGGPPASSDAAVARHRRRLGDVAEREHARRADSGLRATAATGAKSAAGTSWRAATSPAVVAPPWS